MEQDVILLADHISFHYFDDNERPIPVLKDLSLTVNRGEFVAVLGHNGSGKSTLAKHFNAILLPETGNCIVDGINTREENRLYDIRQRVGMVFQNPDNQIVATIVEEDVAFALENMGVSPAEIRKRVDDALKSVGMYEFREHAPHLLSGGQKQRLCIARALLKHPKVLILDDSTSAVDTATDSRIRAAFAREIPGTTKIIIAQRISSVQDADRILVLDDGHINGFDTHENLLKSNAIYREIYESQMQGGGDFDQPA